MCLIAIPGERKVANEDIHVWKLVVVRKDEQNHWTGPFYREQVFPFDELIETCAPEESSMNHVQLERNTYIKDNGEHFSHYIKVGEGFIHSCDSEFFVNRISSNLAAVKTLDVEYWFVVTEGIIPKGSVYYAQKHHNHTDYASSKIIVQKPKNFKKTQEEPQTFRWSGNTQSNLALK